MDSAFRLDRRPTTSDRDERGTYVPKIAYLGTPMALYVAIRVTAHCVVDWCDEYSVQAGVYAPAGGLADQWPGRAGSFPADPAARQTALEEIFDWLEQTRGRPDASVSLTNGGNGVLVQDGAHFLLFLTPSQFAVVQGCWERHGLPRDLCYPGEEDTEAVDPLPGNGDPAAARRRFLAACVQFMPAVSLRHLELLDPGMEQGEEERRFVGRLDAALGVAMLHAARVADWWRRPG